MQTLIAILAAALTLSLAQLGDTSRAQAGDIPEFCKHRYN
jgi:hypothetical protein